MSPRAPTLARPARLLRGIGYPLRLWNWKSAALSGAIRSSVYFFVAMHAVHRFAVHGGRQAGLRAAAIEAIYVALTAGIYSGLQQGALRIRPRWASALIIVAGVPVFAQAVDYSVQHAAGTPGARAASLGMVGWSLLSAAFHLHLMRNGSMLVGNGARSFKEDLRRMPWLVATFVAAPVVLTRSALRARTPAPTPTMETAA